MVETMVENVTSTIAEMVNVISVENINETLVDMVNSTILDMDNETTQFPFTMFTEPLELPPWHTPKLWIVVCCVFYTIMAITGSFGNILTIVAIATTRRMLQVVPNIYVLSLAVADLGVCALLMPMAILAQTIGLAKWLCKGAAFFSLFFHVQSAFHLGVIAANRWVPI